MGRAVRLGSRGVFAAAVMASLGLGAMQALASHRSAAASETCASRCDSSCRLAGWAGGVCGWDTCICYEF